MERATAAALEAERAAESTKTELISARTTFAMREAELRARLVQELDAKVAAAVDDAKAAAAAAERRRVEEEDRAAREVARADDAWAAARRHERRSASLLSLVIVAVAVIAGLGYTTHSMARKVERKDSRLWYCETARAEVAEGANRTRSTCLSSVDAISKHASALATASYFYVSAADVAGIKDRADAARDACASQTASLAPAG